MKRTFVNTFILTVIVATVAIAPRFIEASSPAVTQLDSSFNQIQLIQNLETLPMTAERLDSILRDTADTIEFEDGQWRITWNNHVMVVLVNEEHDRMRIVAPISSVENLTPVQQYNMLLANFHTALDARYAVSDGLIVSTFVHPLSSLQERDFRAALNQVSSLAVTFGSTYSSGDLILRPNSETPQGQPDAVGDGLAI